MAASPLGTRAYYGILLTAITARVSLAALITSAYAALSPSQEVPPLTGSHVILYAPLTNAATVYVGDAALTTTNFADQLPTSTATFRSALVLGPFRNSMIPLADIFVMAADGSTPTTLGIQVIPA